MTVVPAQPPTATTLSATNISKTGFQMNAFINPNGVATSAYFEWSASASFSPINFTSTANIGSGTGNFGLFSTLSGGLCGTVYYYRAVAVSASGNVVRGSVVSVTTLPCP